jgi:transketolase
MRRAFVAALTELATRDERIFLITGDLGFMALEPYIEAHPDRFLNIGASEQQMVATATGLALEGFTPYCYSIATFSVLRPFEFIRNGPIAHQLPVRIVGVGAGFDYGSDGLTHYALEDIGILRTQPGLAIVAPADRRQVPAAVDAVQALDGPAYLRLCRLGDEVPGTTGEFEFGRNQVIRGGDRRWIVALAEAGHVAIEALSDPRLKSANVGVLLVTTLEPFDASSVLASLANCDEAFVVESHYRNGGLGSLICETISGAGLGCRVHRLGLHELPMGVTGSSAYMTSHFDMDSRALADRICETL